MGWLSDTWDSVSNGVSAASRSVAHVVTHPVESARTAIREVGNFADNVAENPARSARLFRDGFIEGVSVVPSLAASAGDIVNSGARWVSRNTTGYDWGESNWGDSTKNWMNDTALPGLYRTTGMQRTVPDPTNPYEGVLYHSGSAIGTTAAFVGGVAIFSPAAAGAMLTPGALVIEGGLGAWHVNSSLNEDQENYERLKDSGFVESMTENDGLSAPGSDFSPSPQPGQDYDPYPEYNPAENNATPDFSATHSRNFGTYSSNGDTSILASGFNEEVNSTKMYLGNDTGNGQDLAFSDNLSATFAMAVVAELIGNHEMASELGNELRQQIADNSPKTEEQVIENHPQPSMA